MLRVETAASGDHATTAFEAGAEGAGRRRWPGWPLHLPVRYDPTAGRDVRIGAAGDGLPVSLQPVAAQHRCDLVRRAAHTLYEAGWRGSGRVRRSHHEPPPPPPSPPPTPPLSPPPL
ncbi:hypothetical protein GCM10023080_065050 [Streptomyces pseudoechinosporeus]